ncbi:chromate efflux transporter [Govanella unica]|uniref:Chromate efflux transporter n=1 Tax=Govanella unica TaxID=2975056 RepID=A0A9X3Z6R3_9PROT|nr:chromate efflux transporter [Govania unica]MDA5193470.1 chromate efflux transporter [Govania unica]
MTLAPGFGEAVLVWLRIGCLSFGGPAGQIALMHRILVEEKRWISEPRFLHALNYCMLLPGPEAQQLAVYVGWLLHRTLGGVVAGLLFVLPGALVMQALAALYAGFHALAPVAALFFGIKAAVLAIVIEALLRISRRALRNGWLYVLAGASFLALFLFGLPFPLVILMAGLIGFSQASSRVFEQPPHEEEPLPDHTRPRPGQSLRVLLIWGTVWLLPLLLLVLLLGRGHVLTEIGLFFSQMAVVTFGGAYAVLSYVAQEAVQQFGWLAPGEMFDGLGLAETTPGPLILVLEFVGFLAAFRDSGMVNPYVMGAFGALVVLWMTFAPCFLWIFLGAPYIEVIRGNRRLNAALTAITAAVCGVILNLSLWFALHVLFRDMVSVRIGGVAVSLPEVASFDGEAFMLALVAALAVFYLRLGILPVLGLSAGLGILMKAL